MLRERDEGGWKEVSVGSVREIVKDKFAEEFEQGTRRKRGYE